MSIFMKFAIVFLIFLASTNAAKNPHRDTFVVESGEEQLLEDCRGSFVSYKNYFLRGVKEEYFITYNQTSEADCMKYCCLEKHFECSSFSYFAVLKACYVMNLTKHDDKAQLVPFVGITHYDKFVPTESPPNTTAIITTPMMDAATTEDTTVDEVETETTTAAAQLPTTPTAEALTFVFTTSSLSDVTTPSLVKSVVTTEGSEIPEETYKTELLTDAPATTMEVMNATELVIVYSDEKTSESPSELTSSSLDSSSFTPNCFGECLNGGECKFKGDDIDEKPKTSDSEAGCVCEPGYDGTFCEKKSESSAQVDDGQDGGAAAQGLPSYVIAVAVVAFLIIIILIVVFTTYGIYRKKTGQYRVKNQRERWNKRTRKAAEARRSNSFLSADPKSPMEDDFHLPMPADTTGALSTITNV